MADAHPSDRVEFGDALLARLAAAAVEDALDLEGSAEAHAHGRQSGLAWRRAWESQHTWEAAVARLLVWLLHEESSDDWSVARAPQ